MNREIKFRAWNETTGVMVPWEDLILEKSEGNNFYLIGHKESKAWIRYDHKQHLMQYTGLKDINGVEIYEGDIIEAGFLMDGLLLTDSGVVVFKEYRFIVEQPDYGDEDLVDWTLGESLEVIGNIYENPELLKEDTR